MKEKRHRQKLPFVIAWKTRGPLSAAATLNRNYRQHFGEFVTKFRTAPIPQ